MPSVARHAVRALPVLAASAATLSAVVALPMLASAQGPGTAPLPDLRPQHHACRILPAPHPAAPAGSTPRRTRHVEVGPSAAETLAVVVPRTTCNTGTGR